MSCKDNTNAFLTLNPGSQSIVRPFPHSPFHSTAFTAATSRAIKKRNNLKKEQRWKEAEARKPSVVLGTRPGDEAKWENSDLRRVIIDVDQLISSTKMIPVKLPVGTVNLPPETAFGVGEAEKKMLLHDLPMLSTPSTDIPVWDVAGAEAAARRAAVSQARELHKANAFAKLIDLRNANAGGIAYENRRRIVQAFSTPENPFNPGRSEVQGLFASSPSRTRDADDPGFSGAPFLSN